MADKIQCPNCLMVAEKSGNSIICEHCDATYKVTKTGPAKAEQIGWKENLEDRVKKNEEQIAGLLGDGDEPEPDGDDLDQIIEDEEPILPE